MRGEAHRKRFVVWGGPPPEPGQGVKFDHSPKIYVIRERIPATPRMRRTVFVLWLIELGPEDPPPAIVHRCVRNIRNHGWPPPTAPL